MPPYSNCLDITGPHNYHFHSTETGRFPIYGNLEIVILSDYEADNAMVFSKLEQTILVLSNLCL